jgi:RND family efflux transporter MFP subunit
MNDINVKEGSYQQIGQLIQQLQKIRSFTGHPVRFWPAFLELATRLSRGRAGMLVARVMDGGSWQRLHVWSAKESNLIQAPEIVPFIEQAAESSVSNSSAWDCKRANVHNGTDLLVLGIRLELDEPERVHAAVFILDEMHAERVEQTAMHLKMIADTPAIYQRGREAQQAVNDTVMFSEALDLMVLLNTEKRYMAAAMTFVNEVASRYRCQRVSLGWLDSGYVRLQSISHMERFEKKMDIVQTLESAMEEAFDQNEEIVWPLPRNSMTIARDHESFSRDQGVQFMLSVPIRLDDKPMGVLTCERAEAPFTESDARGIRVLCDQAARRLGDLKENDRWFGARLAAVFRRKASRLLGVEHTLAKCVGLVVCGVLMFLFLGTLQYRIEAPFILKSDDVRFIPAPFKGYIDEVHVDVGDQVDQGTLLLAFDTRDLLLEESAAIANQIRYSREAEKARAENELAEMKIALALADQARARLDLVRYHLSQAELRAPFSGIVVEGDLEDLLGAPVTKGDVMFKVSRIEKMYVELEVSEKDIHELKSGASGEIAFVSQPQLKFPIEVVRINPVTNAKKEEGNVFRVRCRFPEGMADWWRPGMSGVAKIHAGKRNVLWILTHQTVDFFRMRLWW